ncbi:PQQ-dependent sugar dehydrogenase [uncultured Psychroserpens sp.]|uniref:PQQ-dependent sugar dehydrogenase n=1 Tax=uncultured Psychroserpens sp. TaxID=255436 RepID=UPI002619AB0B|nr:PQQ-dependent sugar dehydrogenase [uncultured Psychroserpens sp.]
MLCSRMFYNIRIILFVLTSPCLLSNVFAQLPSGYSVTEVQSGYNNIMGVVFSQDGTKMFVWEKRGHVYVSVWDGTDYIKQTTPVLDISDEVGDWRDFGFASFCLDPDFDTNGLVYMYYMVDREHLMNFGTPDYDPNDNDYFEASISRLTRYQLNLGSNPLTTNYSSRTVLLGETVSTGVPLTHQSHAGGTVIFANDGTLLVSTGDNASYNSVDIGSASETYFQQAIDDGIMRPEENVGAFRSQMPTSLCGKVLRLDPNTGDGIPSNPFYEAGNARSAKSRMWAMGLRHPFRMSIQPESGSNDPNDGDPGIIYVADVGWGTWEDLHIFDKPGLNGGWPIYEGQTELNGYANSGATNADENDELFLDNCPQPNSFNDDPNPQLRRYVHDRPEVAWRHGSQPEARVPTFFAGIALAPRIGDFGSPTTGVEFNGNAGIAGVYVVGDALGTTMEGKYLFTDYVRNWINVATLTDGSQNWISDVSELAPANFGSGIVHMMQNPLDGFVYYVNIFQGNVVRIEFEGPRWTNEPMDIILECDDVTDFDSAFNSWLNSVTGTVGCGTPTITNNSSGLSDLCGATGSETVRFTLSDDCGNEIFKDATFTIEDTTDPVWDNIPEDVTVDCSDTIQEAYDNWLAGFLGSDLCGDALVTHDGPATISCNQIVSVTFDLTDDCLNSISVTGTFTVEETLGVSDVNNFNQIIISPNPAKNQIEIAGMIEEGAIEIYSITGQNVFKSDINNAEVITLNLPSGFYMVKVLVRNEYVVKKLVIK